jgi:2-polyprenyl-3-methyl-5-hydroxy-6-metoxy-1,4-benzoquinol methylase
MTPATQERLLALNRTFYQQVAVEFDRSRAGLPVGWAQLHPLLMAQAQRPSLAVLDVGCGNGRFVRLFDALGVPVAYVGMDSEATLLALATQQHADLAPVQPQWVQADLTTPSWVQALPTEPARFDLIVCLAVLHHLPGGTLRARVLRELAGRLAADGVLVCSTWQFLTSARFVEKGVPWASVGLAEDEVEPGDFLLPWQQGGYAVRYVHQIDEAEMTQLAQAASLTITDTFYADGKEGNLNLYTILKIDPARPNPLTPFPGREGGTRWRE